MHVLRQLRKFNPPQELLIQFYPAIIQSVRIHQCPVWIDHRTRLAEDCNGQQDCSKKIIGASLLSVLGLLCIHMSIKPQCRDPFAKQPGIRRLHAAWRVNRHVHIPTLYIITHCKYPFILLLFSLMLVILSIVNLYLFSCDVLVLSCCSQINSNSSYTYLTRKNKNSWFRSDSDVCAVNMNMEPAAGEPNFALSLKPGGTRQARQLYPRITKSNYKLL